MQNDIDSRRNTVPELIFTILQLCEFSYYPQTSFHPAPRQPLLSQSQRILLGNKKLSFSPNQTQNQ